MFVKNIWYVAAWAYEVEGDTFLDRSVAGERVVFFRTADGSIKALENRCVHRAAPLSLGIREGDSVRCAYHGLKFSAEGKCEEIPGQQVIPPNACVRSYAVAEMGGWIWLWPGDASRADTGLIPRFKHLGEPGWHVRTGYLHYAADYQLVNDNLLDLSHISYLHNATFGGGNMKWAELIPEVRRTESGFEFERWMINQPGAPSNKGSFKEDSLFDFLNIYQFVAPGVLSIESKFQKSGTGTREKMSNVEYRENMSWQAITPEADGSTHYFFSIAIPDWDDEAKMEGMNRGLLLGFEEDRVMIEAQQKVLAGDETGRPLSGLVTAHDSPMLQMRRMIRRMIDDEARGS